MAEICLPLDPFGFLDPSIPQEDIPTLDQVKNLPIREICATWSEPVYHIIHSILELHGGSVLHPPLRLAICAFISSFASATPHVPKVDYTSLAREAIVEQSPLLLVNPREEDVLALAIIAGIDHRTAPTYIKSFLDISDSLRTKAGNTNILQSYQFRDCLLTVTDHLLRTLHELDNFPPATRRYLESRICRTVDRTFGLQSCRDYENYRGSEEKDFLTLFSHLFIVLRGHFHERLHHRPCFEVSASPTNNASILRFVRDCLTETPASTLHSLIEGQFGKAAGIVLSGQDPNAEWGRILAALVSILYRQFCETLVAMLDGSSNSERIPDALVEFLEYARDIFKGFSDGQLTCHHYNIPSYTDDTLKKWTCEIQCLKELLEPLVSSIWSANSGIFHAIFVGMLPWEGLDRGMLIVRSFEDFGAFMGLSSLQWRRCECCDTDHLP